MCIILAYKILMRLPQARGRCSETGFQYCNQVNFEMRTFMNITKPACEHSEPPHCERSAARRSRRNMDYAEMTVVILYYYSVGR